MWRLRVAGFLAALLAATSEAAPNGWGTRPYDEELPLYTAEVAKHQQEHARQAEQIAAKREEADAFLRSFLYPGAAAEIEASYRRSSLDARNREERHETAARAAQAAERVYRKHKANVDTGLENERSNSTRSALWYEHLYWLQLRQEAERLELEKESARFVGLRGAAGLDWSEFWDDTYDDFVYVIQETGKKLGKEIVECFSNLLRTSLTGAFSSTAGMAPTVHGAPVAVKQPELGDLVDAKGCVTGPLMNTFVNALAMSWKKQFLDDMRRRGVIDEVAVYWWDEVIMSDEEEKAFLDKVHQETVGPEGLVAIVNKHVSETSARVLAAAERPAVEKQVEALVKAGKLKAADVKKTVLETGVTKARENVESLAAAAKLGVDYTNKLAQLWTNSATFAQIEGNELGKYRKVVECLQAQKSPVSGKTVLPHLRVDAGAESYVAFLRTCEAGADPRAWYVLTVNGVGLDSYTGDGINTRQPGQAAPSAVVDGLQRRQGRAPLVIVKLKPGAHLAAVIDEMRRIVGEPKCRRAPSIPPSDVVETPGGELGMLPEIWESVGVEAAGPFPDLGRARAALPAESWKVLDVVPAAGADAVRRRVACEARATPAPVAVPDVAGLTAEQAVARLKAVGLAAEAVAGTPPRSPAEQYTIERQEPAPRSMVVLGSAVRIAVRPAYVDPRRAVPSVVGLAAAAADARLKAAGFVPQVEGGDPAPSAERAFTVQDQRPAGGASAAPGSSVVVRVYAQAASTRRTVPNLAGLSAADADRRLKELGLVPEMAGGGPAPSAERSFTVQSQQPAAGAPVEVGARVQVRVYAAFVAPRPVAPSPSPSTGPVPGGDAGVPPGGDPSVFRCPPFHGRRGYAEKIYRPGIVSCMHNSAGVGASMMQWKVGSREWFGDGKCGAPPEIRFVPMHRAMTGIDVATGRPAEQWEAPRMHVKFWGARRHAMVGFTWSTPHEAALPPEVMELGQRLIAEAEWRGEPCPGSGLGPAPSVPAATRAPSAAPASPAAPAGTPVLPNCTGLLGQGDCRP